MTPIPRLGRRWWWITGAVLIVAAIAISAIASESVLAGLLIVFAGFWVIAALCLVTWRVWRWITYRVGMRLAFTYLLIGVLPLFHLRSIPSSNRFASSGSYWVYCWK